MKSKVGQPAERWTRQRRRNQSQSAKHAWSKLTPLERLRRVARVELEKRPMDEDEFYGHIDDLIVQLFFDQLDELLDMPPHKFHELAKRAEIEPEAIRAFRAKFIVEFANEE